MSVERYKKIGHMQPTAKALAGFQFSSL